MARFYTTMMHHLCHYPHNVEQPEYELEMLERLIAALDDGAGVQPAN